MIPAEGERKRRFQFPRALLIGSVGGAVFLVGYVVDLLLRGAPGLWAGVAVPAGGTVVAGIGAVASSRLDREGPEPGSAGIGDKEERRRGTRRRGAVALPTGLVVLVLLVGCLSWGATLATQYVVGRVTGAEQGVNRLAEPREISKKGVTIRVEAVEDTRHFTRVTATVTNDVSNSISLPLSTNCTLSDAQGSTLQADPFKSDWAEQLPPGAKQRGVFIFPGHLSAAATTARFSFASIFEQGFKGPRSITVTRIHLEANGS